MRIGLNNYESQIKIATTILWCKQFIPPLFVTYQRTVKLQGNKTIYPYSLFTLYLQPLEGSRVFISVTHDIHVDISSQC